MNYQLYAKRLKEYQNNKRNLTEEERKKQFKLNNKDLNAITITGVGVDKKNNKLILGSDKARKQNVLLYANAKNDIYYLNGGGSLKDLVNNTFGKDTGFEVIDKHFFVYNKKDKSLTNYEQLKNYPNLEKIEFDTDINSDRKNRLTDKNMINDLSKERLALSLGLSSNAFKDDLKITGIEQTDDNKSLVTIDNDKTNKQEYFVSDFKDSFIEKVKNGLEVSPQVKLGFEEVKNGSLQIAMGFLEFYGAEFDESTLERDPKLILDEKGYTVSEIGKKGNRNDLTDSTTSLDKALQLARKQKVKEQDLMIELEHNNKK